MRKVAQYFYPQGMTKVMNEGWAVYWHSKLMTQHFVEAIDSAGILDRRLSPARIPWSAITGTLTVASAALSAYHGGKRNQSIGWGVWWFMMGLLFPIVTPVIGIAQGFGRPKEK